MRLAQLFDKRPAQLTEPTEGPDESSGQASLAEQLAEPAVSVLAGGSHRTLYEALRTMSPKLGSLYLGALITHANEGNPDRLPQAAHSLRELMNAMPKALGVEVKALDERLGDRLDSFRGSWTPLHARGQADDPWNGQIDRPIRRFLTRSGRFFSWYDDHRPRRRAEFGDTLNRLTPSTRVLPAELQATNIAVWESMRDYFIAVCHHRETTDAETFDRRLDQLKSFLLDRMRPRTFDDFDAMDAVIAEGESA
jgi:hypothetical protein